MNQTPDFTGRLDFSQFHDLAHAPFSAHCHNSYGGPRRHLYLWSQLIAYPAVRRATACRIRRHRWAQGSFRQADDTWREEIICEDCMTSQDERTRRPLSR